MIRKNPAATDRVPWLRAYGFKQVEEGLTGLLNLCFFLAQLGQHFTGLDDEVGVAGSEGFDAEVAVAGFDPAEVAVGGGYDFHDGVHLVSFRLGAHAQKCNTLDGWRGVIREKILVA
jgi:hypothetical protein